MPGLKRQLRAPSRAASSRTFCPVLFNIRAEIKFPVPGLMCTKTTPLPVRPLSRASRGYSGSKPYALRDHHPGPPSITKRTGILAGTWIRVAYNASLEPSPEGLASLSSRGEAWIEQKAKPMETNSAKKIVLLRLPIETDDIRSG